MEIRNASWNASGGIDAEVKHHRFGWMPITLRADDSQTAGLFAAAAEGAAAYVDPGPADPSGVLAAWRASAKVSRFQARAALHLAGLLPAVEAAIAQADPVAQIAWADAVEFRRSSPTIAALATALGLSDEQVDGLFQSAAEIVA